MNKVIDLQKRINKLIPVTDCIAYVKQDNDDYLIELTFIRLKKTASATIESLNLSNECLSKIVTRLAKQVLNEMAPDAVIVEH